MVFTTRLSRAKDSPSRRYPIRCGVSGPLLSRHSRPKWKRRTNRALYMSWLRRKSRVEFNQGWICQTCWRFMSFNARWWSIWIWCVSISKAVQQLHSAGKISVTIIYYEYHLIYMCKQFKGYLHLTFDHFLAMEISSGIWTTSTSSVYFVFGYINGTIDCANM